MNKLFKSLILVLFVSTSLFAKIIESERMSEILKEVTSRSIVIFDLDNTILEASQTLGSDQWFEYRLHQRTSAGMPIEEAVRITSEEWEAINYRGKVNLVEQETVSIIHSLQEDGIPTMGLTARPSTFLDQSLRQLERLEVPFHPRTISDKVVTIQDKDTAIFKEGLMSVGSNNKGTILLTLLKKLNIKPSRIVFVDDKLKNVSNVDKALNDASIPSFAFRYGAADAKVKAFDAKLADFEFNYFTKFGVVLSDRQARQLMR